MGFEIKSADARYAQVYAAWELNGTSSQFDTLFDDDSGENEGGALIRVYILDGEPHFFQEASLEETTIPVGANGKVDPGWAFINDFSRGMHGVPTAEGLPGLRSDHLPNKLR